MESVPFENPEEQQKEPLRIMLLGKSGAGKSSSGNTILGKEEFKADMRVVRVTRHCEKREGKVNDVPGDETGKPEYVPVTVIDTPGFFELDRKGDTVRDILKRVKLMEPGPHAFILVVPVRRMTQEDQDTQTLIETWFGPKIWDYTILLFTHGDCLGNKTINTVISESDETFRSFIRKCRGGFHVFNNKNPQDQSQVTKLIQKIQTLLALNGNKHYGTEMYPEEERKIRERQESLLTEKDEEIKRTEKQLEERFCEKELEMMKEGLWRKKEEEARKEAEKEIKSNELKLRHILGIIIAVVVLLIPVASADRVGPLRSSHFLSNTVPPLSVFVLLFFVLFMYSLVFIL